MKKLVTLTIIMALVFLVYGTSNAEAVDLSENEIISLMTETFAFSPENPEHDPFRPIIKNLKL